MKEKKHSTIKQQQEEPPPLTIVIQLSDEVGNHLNIT